MRWAGRVLSGKTEMQMRRRGVVLTILLGSTSVVQAQGEAWLKGRWELKFDPDGSPKDHLEFGESGQVANISPQGRVVSGLYVVRDGTVRISFVLPNGKTLPLMLVPSEDRRQLRLKSEKTGNVAIYEKARP